MKRKVFKSGSLKSKGLAAIVISLLFALVLSACSVVAVDNKPIEGGVDVTSETKNGGQTLPFTLANLGTAINTYNFAYKASAQEVTLKAGCVYKFEVWGARGGRTATYGGLGGYSKGWYSLASSSVNKSVYVFTGGAGGTAVAGSYVGGGWNGGGDVNGAIVNSASYLAGGGGGGTDIRTTNTIYSQAQWDAFTNATDPRLIVAGGGGGDSTPNGDTGGAGGGVSGDGKGSNSFGGTQTAGGAAGYNGGQPGVAGKRWSGGTRGGNSDSGAGGGGWFGGGSGGGTTSSGGSGGGGGSGWIGGVDSLSNDAATMTTGTWADNGKAVITEYSAYVAKSPAYTGKFVGTSFSVPKLDVAVEGSSSTTALVFNTSNLYTNTTGSSASAYVTVTGNSDSLTVTPIVPMTNQTLYAQMKTAGGAVVYVPLTITAVIDYNLKTASYLNKTRLTSFSIPKLDVAVEASNNTTALTFNNTTNLYTDQSGTSASAFFTVTGTADTLTVTPKVSIESRTFYAYMKTAFGTLVYAPITISTKNDLMIMKS